MRYRITGLALPESVTEDPRQLTDVLSRVLGLSTADIMSPEVVKHSLDARRRPARHIWSVELEVPDGAQLRPRPPRGAHIKALDEGSRLSARYAPGVLAELQNSSVLHSGVLPPPAFCSGVLQNSSVLPWRSAELRRSAFQRSAEIRRSALAFCRTPAFCSGVRGGVRGTCQCM